jgi:hypothetical protein
MVMRCGYGDDNNKPVALRYVGALFRGARCIQPDLRCGYTGRGIFFGNYIIPLPWFPPW